MFNELFDLTDTVAAVLSCRMSVVVFDIQSHETNDFVHTISEVHHFHHPVHHKSVCVHL